MDFLNGLRLEGPAAIAATLAGAVLAGLLAHRVFWWLFGRMSRSTSTSMDDSIVRHVQRPTLLIPPVLLVQIVLPLLGADEDGRATMFLSNVLKVLLPLSIGWTVIALSNVVGDLVLERHDLEQADNLRARMVVTQFRIFKRIVVVAVALITLAVILMSFEALRQLGTGLLASAGIAGLILGLAAQKTLANLLAGVQLAITQPIRLDDVVIVEGEWGRVEEITLTYVVVRIWDLRRLIVPIGYFLETPFQNWTRVSADILGTVHLHLDHTVPVDSIREELQAIVQGAEEWDGKLCKVQVTDTSPQGIDVRVLISAGDASKAWDLRCKVREQLVEFVRREFPGSLPRLRAELDLDLDERGSQHGIS